LVGAQLRQSGHVTGAGPMGVGVNDIHSLEITEEVE
jgi:hypothetical protein